MSHGTPEQHHSLLTHSAASAEPVAAALAAASVPTAAAAGPKRLAAVRTALQARQGQCSETCQDAGLYGLALP